MRQNATTRTSLFARLALASIALGGLALPGLLSGCTSQGPYTGEYTFLTGNLVTHEAATLDEAWAATQGAVSELQFNVKSQVKDALDAKLVAKQADGDEVEIKLARASERVTRISVRVGIIGDEARSRLIMDKIKGKL